MTSMTKATFALVAFSAFSVDFGVLDTCFAEDQPHQVSSNPFTSGEVKLALRYRFETVDQDTFDDDATASTLRAAFGYTTGTWKRFHLGFEVESIIELGFEDRFDNKGAGSHWNGVSDRPVIADPALTELNQFFVGVELAGETTMKVGRFETAFADQRFLGPVGWRQNHQSFEGARLDTSFGRKNLIASYLYIDEVHRIFGDSKDMASHVVELELKTARGKFGAFLYDLEYDSSRDAPLSTRTYGARWSHRHTISSGWDLGGRFHIAEQAATGDNPVHVEASYVLGEVSARKSGWTATLAGEVLGGKPGSGKFSTPLATLHKFNGWADTFLTTPASGLVDTWIALAWGSKTWSVRGIYHQFDADSGSSSYGSEFDWVVTYTAPWNQQFLLKGAHYEANHFSVDTNKVWLQTVWQL